MTRYSDSVTNCCRSILVFYLYIFVCGQFLEEACESGHRESIVFQEIVDYYHHPSKIDSVVNGTTFHMTNDDASMHMEMAVDCGMHRHTEILCNSNANTGALSTRTMFIVGSKCLVRECGMQLKANYDRYSMSSASCAAHKNLILRRKIDLWRRVANGRNG